MSYLLSCICFSAIDFYYGSSFLICKKKNRLLRKRKSVNNEIFRIHHAEWMSLLIITSAKDNIMAEAKIFTFSNRFWVSLAGPNIRPRKLYPGYSLTCKGSQPQPHQELLLYILWIYTCTHTKYIRDNWCSHRFKNTDICSSSQYVNSV